MCSVIGNTFLGSYCLQDISQEYAGSLALQEDGRVFKDAGTYESYVSMLEAYFANLL